MKERLNKLLHKYLWELEEETDTFNRTKFLNVSTADISVWRRNMIAAISELLCIINDLNSEDTITLHDSDSFYKTSQLVSNK